MLNYNYEAYRYMGLIENLIGVIGGLQLLHIFAKILKLILIHVTAIKNQRETFTIYIIIEKKNYSLSNILLLYLGLIFFHQAQCFPLK